MSKVNNESGTLSVTTSPNPQLVFQAKVDVSDKVKTNIKISEHFDEISVQLREYDTMVVILGEINKQYTKDGIYDLYNFITCLRNHTNSDFYADSSYTSIVMDAIVNISEFTRRFAVNMIDSYNTQLSNTTKWCDESVIEYITKIYDSQIAIFNDIIGAIKLAYENYSTDNMGYIKELTYIIKFFHNETPDPCYRKLNKTCQPIMCEFVSSARNELTNMVLRITN